MPALRPSNRKLFRTGVGARTEVKVAYEGAIHYFDLIVEPLRDPGGTFLGLICSATDITPSKNLIAKLQEALDQINVLSGLLSICASCKRIRDEHQIWQPLVLIGATALSIRPLKWICFVADLSAQKRTEAELRARTGEMAQSKLSDLEGLICACAWCKRIHDGGASWQPLEVYIEAHSKTKFTHGICHDCLGKLDPVVY